MNYRLIIVAMMICIPIHAGVIDFIEEWWDDDGSEDRVEEVKAFYSKFEYWDQPEVRPLSQPFLYDSSDVQLQYFKAKEGTPQYPSMVLVHQADTLYKAKVYILKGQGDTLLLNQPLVVGDAFDPLNKRGLEDLLNQERYANLLKVDPDDGMITPREMGYDIVFVDFKQGGGRLNYNAEILTSVLLKVQSQSESPMVLAGISMSGILARMSLLYSESKNNVYNRELLPNVIGWLSIDSPQQGAVITTLQRALVSMIKDEDMAEIMALGDVDNTLAAQHFQLNVPGAYQMLKTHYNDGAHFSSEVYDNFQAHLIRMGEFPKRYGVAIAYSNFYLPHPNQDPLQRQVYKRLKVKEARYSYDIEAGGADGSRMQAELEPGSTGNWYYNLFEGTQGEYMQEAIAGEDEAFKGTFVPIRSALYLQGIDWKTFAQTEDGSYTDGEYNRQVASYSLFDRVYWMNGPNQYAREFFDQSGDEIEDLRYEHMVFDRALMAQIEKALKRIQYQSAYVAATGLF